MRRALGGFEWDGAMDVVGLYRMVEHFGLIAHLLRARHEVRFL